MRLRSTTRWPLIPASTRSSSTLTAASLAPRRRKRTWSIASRAIWRRRHVARLVHRAAEVVGARPRHQRAVEVEEGSAGDAHSDDLAPDHHHDPAARRARGRRRISATQSARAARSRRPGRSPPGRHAARVQVGAQRPGRRAGGRVLPALHQLREHPRPRRSLPSYADQVQVDAPRSSPATSRPGRSPGPRWRSRPPRCTRCDQRRRARSRPSAAAAQRCASAGIRPGGRHHVMRLDLRAERRRLLQHRRRPHLAVAPRLDRLQAGTGLLHVRRLALAARLRDRNRRPERRVPGEGHLAGHGPDAVAVVGARPRWSVCTKVVSARPGLARERRHRLVVDAVGVVHDARAIPASGRSVKTSRTVYG